MFSNKYTNFTFRLLCVVSFFVFAFGYGFLASQFKLFPYVVLRDAQAALIAMTGAHAPGTRDGLASYQRHVRVPTAVRHSPTLVEDFVLVSGMISLTGENRDGQETIACIIDRDGRVRHSWQQHPHLWDNLKRVTRIPGVSGPIGVAGLHLFDNGELLATFHGFNTFPFAIGMARFDRNSNVLWKKELLTHHCFSVASDGRIFVPGLEVIDSPLRIGETAAVVESENGKLYHDLILVLDPAGNELERISVKDALFNSGWRGHLIRSNAEVVISDDPLHLNDVQLIGAAAAAELPGIEPDDLLVSLRNINTIGILDPHSKRFKWLSSGAAVGQHSPRVYRHGVLVLDNLGGDRRLGGTQLVHIDFPSGLPKTLFPRAGVGMPDLCRTANSGHLDVHQDGRHALATLTHEGSIWEVDLQSGEVVWEFINVDPQGDGKRRLIGLAKYVSNLTFIES